ncbi:DUF4132 domain-containing protein [Streptomyces sp. YC504]|uniref:DUF4132 domain-containing protein n=1 Tax=Streptomyces mesophilus TaxID=1775132 RepID=A0A6G4XM38_9ACTN|nr:DUF4132 domain-containing protein [Streptomyces mesophilus]NGO77880.1 DUF4132 domain-containing protein [Streptomyces mesophilus]
MSPEAERLLRALTDSDARLDVREPVELSEVGDDELGTLHAAAFHAGPEQAPWEVVRVRASVMAAARQRTARYAPHAVRRIFEVFIEECRAGRPVDLRELLPVIEGFIDPVPDAPELARSLVESACEHQPFRQPFALLALARLAGEETVRAAVATVARKSGPIVADEMAVRAGLDPAAQRRLAGMDRDHRLVETDAHVWFSAAAHPAYVAFARRALEAAAARAEAIQAREIPYQPEKAFTDREVTVLGDALRVALVRDEDWLPEVCARLLPGIALAPGTAKTLPSQALLYEIARATKEFPTPELVAALRTVRRTVRHAGVPKQLDKMLKKADIALAERTEVALRLPRLDFDDDGVVRRSAGEYEGVVTVTDTAVLTWEKDGRTVKSVPAAVRRNHGDLVKELRDLVKRVNAQLATLLRALEGSFVVDDATHAYALWRSELAGHPLARTLVRRLIWEIELGPDRWQTVLPEADADLPEAPADARVRLWHPQRAEPEAVRRWRELLTERQVRQPFKQAFREIYLLTPAEEETRVYSNRFAAHIVHYRKMFALFRARGWQSRLLGGWDAGEEDWAERLVDSGRWRVTFRHLWTDTEGAHELASTDQVRFQRRESGTWREAPLAEVPPLVFSEAMRDVDLFVGVCSIAADADWTDGGPERAYWERAGFAELTETAEGRKEVLARLLPRLKIAERCTLDGRFLVVRGDLTTYRIHLGSANILMEPDGAYLCIVPDRRRATKGGQVFLPFEDERLGLILSKALLLAADTEIADQSILRQIKRGA